MPSRRRNQPRWMKPISAGTADPGKVSEWAEGLSGGAALCRARRQHLWELRVLKKIKGGHEEIWRCGRCDCRQEFLTDARHRVIEAGNVQYPEGYLAPKGTGRLDYEARGAFRGRYYEDFLLKNPDGVAHG